MLKYFKTKSYVIPLGKIQCVHIQSNVGELCVVIYFDSVTDSTITLFNENGQNFLDVYDSFIARENRV